MKNYFWGILLFSLISPSFAAPGGAAAALAAAAASKTIEAVMSGGADLAESVGCAALGGIKAKELKLIQKVKTGDITQDDRAKLQLAIVSGLCVKGKADIDQRVSTGDIKLGKDACASIATAGNKAGC